MERDLPASAFPLLSLFLAALLTTGLSSASAQAPAEPPEAEEAEEIEGDVDPDTADISITATVRIREIRFDTDPQASVEFFGVPLRITEHTTERENLPDDVEPGVTYRNVVVRLTIASVFAEPERVLSELLGEAAAEAKTPTPPLRPEDSSPEVRP